MEPKIEFVEIKNELLCSGYQNEFKIEQSQESQFTTSINPQVVKVEQDLDNEKCNRSSNFEEALSSRFLISSNNIKKEIKHEPDEDENEFMNYEIDLPTLKNEERVGCSQKQYTNPKNVAKKKYESPICNEMFMSFGEDSDPRNHPHGHASDTDTGDELMDVTLSPSRKCKKRTKKGHLDVKSKETVLNIYKCQLEENPTLSIDEIMGKVAEKTGVGKSTVYKVIKEFKTKNAFSEPLTNSKRKSTIDTLDDLTKNIIKKKVHQFFFQNELPTIDKVLKEVNDDPDLPNFKRSTFYKLLKKLNLNLKNLEESMLVDRDVVL